MESVLASANPSPVQALRISVALAGELRYQGSPMRSRSLLILGIIPLLFGACAHPRRASFSAVGAIATERVWVVSNGWHTSVALRAKDTPAELRALDGKARFFVIGWGGRDVYMWQNFQPWQVFTSVFLPSASAVHVIPVRSSLLAGCPHSEIVEFDTTRDGIARLRERLRGAVSCDAAGQPLVAGPGKSPLSRFFIGSETYIFPKTCNTWAAACLQAAGVPMRASAAIVADNLMWQGRHHGRTLATRSDPPDAL